MEFIFKVVSLLCLVTVINGAAHCNDNWTAYKNKCYRMFFDQFEWGSALNVCLQYGGHLASLSTADEYNFINTYVIGGYTFPVWIGGNDQANEGNWQWTDKSEFKFAAWHGTEPNGGNAEDCMITNYQNIKQWFDVYCYNMYPFICEVPEL